VSHLQVPTDSLAGPAGVREERCRYCGTGPPDAGEQVGKTEGCTQKSCTTMSTTDEGRIVSLSQKGQATIPKELREKHGIEPGTRVHVRENDRGEIVIEPLPSLQDFRGAATAAERGTDILEEGRRADEERTQRLDRDRS
jgi:antitoxin PrlF